MSTFTSGFGASSGTGLNTPKPAIGFGQPTATGGFGQPQQQTTGGFGQPQQQTTGGFGQPQQQGVVGFGQPQQPATGGFGQPQQPAAGGFGQPQQQTAGGFGQPQQPAVVGFGQPQQPATGGFGQPQQQTTGGFGQPQQPAVGGFGQPAATGGFGQVTPGTQLGAAGGFGAAKSGGFGQTGTGFGQPQQPATGGFGQPQHPASGGFGQPQQPAVGGFGQPQQQATGGFGQPQQQATGGFGQPQQPAVGGFGQPQQPATGGFGQPQQPAVGGFGQPQQPATGGFGQPAATGGFGQVTAGTQLGAAGGFGAAKPGGFGQPQQPTTRVFGQATTGTQPAAGGFGAAKPLGGFGQPGPNPGFGTTGGFGQPQQQATGGFGQVTAGTQPAAGGFGAAKPGGFGQTGTGFGQSQQPATGGFGQPQQPAVGGFGQPQQQATGGFGQPQQQATGGFGQPAATGGFGQVTAATQPAAGGFGAAKPLGGFGQPGPNPGFGTTGGFGQPQQQATGGFGQPLAAGGFGQPQQQATGGFGTLQNTNYQAVSDFGKISQNFSTGATLNQALSFMNLPDFNMKPYGEALLASYDRIELEKPTSKETTEFTPIVPQPIRYHWLTRCQQPLDSDIGIEQQPVPLSISAISSSALKAILKPPIQLGTVGNDKKALLLDEPRPRVDELSSNQDAMRESNSRNVFSTPNLSAPTCDNFEYRTVPSLEELSVLPPNELRNLSSLEVSRKDDKVRIEFCEPVNLVRTNISDVVSMDRDGRVRFNPKGDTSSHKGLNVKAIVTVNRVINMTEDQLRETCRAEGSRFISYQNNTWRYAVNDSDEAIGTSLYERPSHHQANLSIQKGDDDDDDNDEDVGVTSPNLQTNNKVDSSCGIVTQAFSGEVELPLKSTQLIPPATLSSAKITVNKTILPSLRPSRELSSLNKQVFKLPYVLPVMGIKSTKQSVATIPYFPMQDSEPPVYYVNFKSSVVHENFVSGSTLRKHSGSSMVLARSFRANWHISGLLAYPSFAAMRDGLETKQDVDEVHGSNVVVGYPFRWTTPSTKPLTACLISVLRLLTRYMWVLSNSNHFSGTKVKAASQKDHYGLLHISLSREKSSMMLSKEKLEEILSIVAEKSSHKASLSPTEFCSLKQCQSVIGLMSALYALPEYDEALPNAQDEARYLRQLRRRELSNWLSNELHDLVNRSSGVYPSRSEELVQIILSHKLKDASRLAEDLNESTLARVIGVCGDGNQFEQYVEMAREGFPNGSVVRDRVVSLLAGKVETFIQEDEYTFEKRSSQGSDSIVAHHNAATWRQLLGIFAFYGCRPDTSAEDIIREFMNRLRTSPRRAKSLPFYAEKLHGEALESRRGRDAVRRGHAFPDAAFLLLKGFLEGGAPPASGLHPHASSYSSTDYLSPFLLLCAVRALPLPRGRPYKDAETAVLLGLAGQLEMSGEGWFWALLPLHMIESDPARHRAVRDFCRRNALQARELRGRPSENAAAAEFDKLLGLLNVDEAELEPVVPPVEQPKEVLVNRPSLKTQEILQKAIGSMQSSLMGITIGDI
ncbi:unnamed protein product [Phytomonas sp. Hart1]|nr:unnamed protein product [Phytomonas sp. Hart1]|eukprot:CCW71133.1 unnamed protein product [Phytomonas sp. isolate Hart1]